MSADNGIYIHKFHGGWAVTHAQAIENIYWNRGKNKYNYNILYEYFKDAPRFDTEDKALEYAFKLYKELCKEYGYVEYGVCQV